MIDFIFSFVTSGCSTISPISFGILISFEIALIFFYPRIKIFLEIPSPFGVLGIKTIYFPAIEIKVLRAAPFCPFIFNNLNKNYLIWFYYFLNFISFKFWFIFFLSFSSFKFSFSSFHLFR